MGTCAGIDWASGKHDVLVVDRAGEELSAATFGQDEDGVTARAAGMFERRVSSCLALAGSRADVGVDCGPRHESRTPYPRSRRVGRVRIGWFACVASARTRFTTWITRAALFVTGTSRARAAAPCAVFGSTCLHAAATAS